LGILEHPHFDMKILTVDIGTGTQDIFLYNSQLSIENGFKLVLPSPTMMVHRQIKQATQTRTPIVLTGVMMGGGPSAWAARDHAKAGNPVYATTEAAKTLDDDLERVTSQGITLVSEDEAAILPDSVQRIKMRDFDLPAIKQVFSTFGVDLSDLGAIAVAVFDHGDAPPGVSDRQFRFDYLDQRLKEKNSLAAFAYQPNDIPPIMTRLQAVAKSAGELDIPLMVMDTAPAAVLGATFDPLASALERKLIVNVGNFHALAFRLGANGIEGVFEHHTGEVDRTKLETLIRRLADGTLTHEDVFSNMGHGALMYDSTPMELGKGGFDVVVTGPRRSMFVGTKHPHSGHLASPLLQPYFAVPFGDMMLAGCFGLLAATAEILPNLTEPIYRSLRAAGGSRTAPWDA